MAREGYVNLLLAHQKRSRAPGDSRDMLMQRRAFLEVGHYRPLRQALEQIVSERVSAQRGDVFPVLDTGCGEGYYPGGMGEALGTGDRQVQIAGIDISRDAVRMAARHYPHVAFAVASNAALPVADGTIDLVLRIFAPGRDEEVRRVLRPGGAFLRVVPGAQHLMALRQRIYARPRPHAVPPVTVPGLVLVEVKSLSYTLHLDQPGDSAKLLGMTPYYWQVNEMVRERIAALTTFETQVDFRIEHYRCEAPFD